MKKVRNIPQILNRKDDNHVKSEYNIIPKENLKNSSIYKFSCRTIEC